MKFRVELTCIAGEQEEVHQVACLERNGVALETLGLALAEGKAILKAIQEVSKRMVKRQQMQWSQRGAHLLLQTRTRVLNDDLEEMFRGWYPEFRPPAPRSPPPEARPPGF